MGWDDVKLEGNSDILKIEAGKKVRLHVLSEEPYSFWQYFNNDTKKGVVVGEDYEDKKKLRRQHALAVCLMDTEEVKLWLMGSRLAGKIKNVYDNYQGLSTVDLVVTRTGTGIQTNYEPVPVPTKVKDRDSFLAGLEIPDLETHQLLQPADSETVEKIMAGEDPSMEFPPAEEAAPEATSEAEPGAEEGEPIQPDMFEDPKPAPKVQPKAANGNGDARTPIIKLIMHAFVTKPKFKDQKVRITLLQKVSKKAKSVNQLTLDELKKLQVLVK